MDEPTRRNYQIEEQFPDGKANSGFNYSFGELPANPPLIVFEVRMTNAETLRLFFEHEHFREFAEAANAVVERVIG